MNANKGTVLQIKIWLKYVIFRILMPQSTLRIMASQCLSHQQEFPSSHNAEEKDLVIQQAR